MIFGDVSEVITKSFNHSLDTLVHVLGFTRDPQKFPSWNADSVAKTFKWADAMHLETARHSEEKCRIVIRAFQRHIMNFDLQHQDKLFKPVLKPFHVTFWVILTSPLLCTSRNASSVAQAVLHHLSIRVDQDIYQMLATELVEYLLLRRRFHVLSRSVQLQFHDVILNIEECGLAFRFLIAIAQTAAPKSDTDTAQPCQPSMDHLQKVGQMVATDPVTLKLVSLSLVLPSIYLLQHLALSSTSELLPPRHWANAAAQPDQHAPQEQKQTDLKYSIDDLVAVQRDVRLWDLAAKNIQSNIVQWLEVDSDLTVTAQLCRVNGGSQKFTIIFVGCLKDLIFTRLKHRADPKLRAFDVRIDSALSVLRKLLSEGHNLAQRDEIQELSSVMSNLVAM